MAEREARDPWNDPTGVRLAATITTSGREAEVEAEVAVRVLLHNRRHKVRDAMADYILLPSDESSSSLVMMSMN